MKQTEGIIVKALSGFYYIKTDRGVVQTRGRGIFRKKGITPLVGDRVQIEIPENGDGVVTDVLPRKNSFKRPPISNADLAVIVFAAAKPDPNFDVVDKFLIMAQSSDVDAVLCMNKTDLVSWEEVQEVRKRYSGAFDLITVCAKDETGIEELKEVMQGRQCFLAGPSGVGKSTIINALIPDACTQTGLISDKTSRGRNTTRHVEIFETDNGTMIYDTPGFTSFDISGVESGELSYYYPEFDEYMGCCRFDNCRHLNEPRCAVLTAVEDGSIPQERYNSYKKIYEEIKKEEDQKHR